MCAACFSLLILLALLIPNVTRNVAYKSPTANTCLCGGLTRAGSKTAVAILGIHVLLQFHFLCFLVATFQIYYYLI
jgi:hypothetical protein